MSLYSALTQVLASFAAKIKGIQTGYDGTEYDSPGEAVRGQINDLHVLIGDTPGAAIQASAVAYGDSDVGTELTNVNGRLEELEQCGLDINVKTVSVTTSNIGTASLNMVVTNATVLSVYSRTGVNGEYCRFTPYVVNTTWYVAAETSSGPVASTALDLVVCYIDKT